MCEMIPSKLTKKAKRCMSEGQTALVLFWKAPAIYHLELRDCVTRLMCVFIAIGFRKK